MPCDLEVDTDKLRFAARLLRGAAEAYAEQHGAAGAVTVDDHAAGSSATAREALRLMTTRSEQAVVGADRLSTIADWLATELTDFAQRFDAAEAFCTAGF